MTARRSSRMRSLICLDAAGAAWLATIRPVPAEDMDAIVTNPSASGLQPIRSSACDPTRK